MEYVNRKGKYTYDEIYSSKYKEFLVKLAEKNSASNEILDVVSDVPLKVDKECAQIMLKIQTISLRCLNSGKVFKDVEDIVKIFEKEMAKNDKLSKILKKLLQVSKIDKKSFYRELAETSLDHHQRASPDFLYMAMNEYMKNLHGHKGKKGAVLECAVMDESCVYPNILNCLKNNDILVPGDKVAVQLPVEDDLVRLLRIRNYNLDIVPIENVKSKAEIMKLKDPQIKAYFLSHPMTVSGEVMSKERIDMICQAIDERETPIIVVMDCSYMELGGGMHGFHRIRRNLVGIHTMSKIHGDRGLNVSCVYVYNNNVIDSDILPGKSLDDVHKRYEGVVDTFPENISFYRRLRLDTKQLYNTLSTLSCQQQLKTAITCVMDILGDSDRLVDYENELEFNKIKLLEPLHCINYIKYYENDNTNHTIMVDIIKICNNLTGGLEFGNYLVKYRDPYEFPAYLADVAGIVVMPGIFYNSDPWSVKINLGEAFCEEYAFIGEVIRELINNYYEEYTSVNEKLSKMNTDVTTEIVKETIRKSIKNVRAWEVFKKFEEQPEVSQLELEVPSRIASAIKEPEVNQLESGVSTEIANVIKEPEAEQANPTPKDVEINVGLLDGSVSRVD